MQQLHDARCRIIRAAFVMMMLACGLLPIACESKEPPPPPNPFPPEVQTKPITAPPELTSEATGSFKDLVFFVQNERAITGGEVEFTARALHKGKPIGFRLRLLNKWGSPNPIPNTAVVIADGRVKFLADGATSDAFVAALDDIYGTFISPTAMKQEAALNVVLLTGDPKDPGAGIIRLKCFVQSGGSGGSFVLNIDAAKGRIEFYEKDPMHRASVVRALSTP